MYVKNGIVYAGNDQKILHVNEAVPHGDCGLMLFFDDGSIQSHLHRFTAVLFLCPLRILKQKMIRGVAK